MEGSATGRDIDVGPRKPRVTQRIARNFLNDAELLKSMTKYGNEQRRTLRQVVDRKS